MLKDCNNDPLIATGGDPVASSIFGQADFQNSPNNASSINKQVGPGMNSPIPRSSHKVVTPLRQQNTSFLVASLESISKDSQGVSEQIAKITSTFVSPASNLANSFASLSTLDTLSDPTLLQSHVQKSLIGLESPYNSTSNNNSALRASTTCNTMGNSLYNTPIRCKQSKSHDFSELPSQQRLRRRRSSILALEDCDNLFESMGEVPLSDLSHFKDNEDDESGLISVNTLNMKDSVLPDESNFNYFDDSEGDDFEEAMKYEISPMKLATKRHIKSQSRAFTLPSTAEYQDGSKPPFSYASLIAQAIISSPKQKLALSNIYSWIMDTYPYYKAQTCGWQNSIRHNLSLNKCFKKIPRDDDEPGKGAYWTVDLDEMDDFEDGMFKRRRSCTSSANSNSNNSSVTGTPKTGVNNAFLNGTGWSPIMNNRTPSKATQTFSNEFRTPQPATKMSLATASVPMTPLTMSVNYFKTPMKKTEESGVPSSTILTPKITANCTNRSPYTSLIRTSNLSANTFNNNSSSTATFWSYPNLSLSQMGLDAEPPLPETESTFCNIFGNDPVEETKLPELFHGSNTTTRTATSTIGEKDVVRMSPLSWLLSVSSQDNSLGLFDQSQQLLSEYLSLNNIM